MKKIIVGFVAVGVLVGVLVLNWGSVHGLLVARPDFAAQHVEPVVMYGTDWCGNCKMTRTYLRENNIPFYEYDVDKSPEGQRQFKALQGTGVPLLLVKNNVVRGFDPTAIQEALRR
ncbi:MAG TPA: glutaredoxin family protein [Gammaproteobacteria bacterium]|nr:glutaredoxin family protein [Gammaproteobacteria bacterium]